MPDANDSDEAVQARLRTVLPGDRVLRSATFATPATPAAGASNPQAAPVTQAALATGSPAGAVPPWAREIAPLPDRDSVRSAGASVPSGGQQAPAGGSEAHAAGLTGLGAFDPGRRGVKALGAVATVVVLVAGFLAWQARPRVEPVEAPPVPGSPVSQAAPGDRSGTDGSSAGAVAGGAGRAASVAGPPGAGTEVVVAVGGKVRRPGLVRLPPGARVADALQGAGGAAAGVDVALLNLARKVVDGELIMVGVTPQPGQPAAGPPAAGASAGGPVNLNTATLADLDTLPGVGPVLAQRILDEREQQGGFKAVADLRKVQGIGSSRYEQLKDLVTV